jgi:FlaA1/EpsC-like NDP-sugar epimerase
MDILSLIRHIHNTIFTWDHFLIIYLVLFTSDTLLLIAAKKYKRPTKYFRVHEEHGLMKMTLFKIIFICVDMYILSSKPSTGAFTAGIQLWYATFIVLALRDLLKNEGQRTETRREMTRH